MNRIEHNAIRRELHDMEVVLKEAINDGSLGDTLARKVVDELLSLRSENKELRKFMKDRDEILKEFKERMGIDA